MRAARGSSSQKARPTKEPTKRRMDEKTRALKENIDELEGQIEQEEAKAGMLNQRAPSPGRECRPL